MLTSGQCRRQASVPIACITVRTRDCVCALQVSHPTLHVPFCIAHICSATHVDNSGSYMRRSANLLSPKRAVTKRGTGLGLWSSCGPWTRVLPLSSNRGRTPSRSIVTSSCCTCHQADFAIDITQSSSESAMSIIVRQLCCQQVWVLSVHAICVSFYLFADVFTQDRDVLAGRHGFLASYRATLKATPSELLATLVTKC